MPPRGITILIEVAGPASSLRAREVDLDLHAGSTLHPAATLRVGRVLDTTADRSYFQERVLLTEPSRVTRDISVVVCPNRLLLESLIAGAGGPIHAVDIVPLSRTIVSRSC